jgi:ADP-heptose:LPS heptosyltransferase
MRMATIKRIDKWAGLILCTLFAPVERLWPRRKRGPIKKVLVIKFWGIGSIIMVGYLLRSIKASAPEAHIDLATLSSNREAAEMVGGADGLVTLDISKGPAGIVVEIMRFLWAIYRNSYDVVLDLEYLTRFTALVTFATRAPMGAGFYV